MLYIYLYTRFIYILSSLNGAVVAEFAEDALLGEGCIVKMRHGLEKCPEPSLTALSDGFDLVLDIIST